MKRSPKQEMFHSAVKHAPKESIRFAEERLEEQLGEAWRSEDWETAEGVAKTLHEMLKSQGNNKKAETIRGILGQIKFNKARRPPPVARGTVVAGGHGAQQAAANQASQGPTIQAIETKVDFNQLFGVTREREEIHMQFVLPHEYKTILKESRSLLMYGPPGTGKTKIASAFANLMRKALKTPNVFLVTASGAELKSMWVGETDKNLKEYFRWSEAYAKAAGGRARTVLFFDEFEALASSRQKAMSQTESTTVTGLLQLLDGIKGYPHVIFIGATNLPWTLDSAVFRRMKTKLFIDVPGYSARRQMIRKKIEERTGKLENTSQVNLVLEGLTQLTGYKDVALEKLTKLGINEEKIVEFLVDGDHDIDETEGENTSEVGFEHAVSPFGFSFGDLDTMLENALNRVVMGYLRRKRKQGGYKCRLVLDPGVRDAYNQLCPNVSSEEKESMRLPWEYLASHQEILEGEIEKFNNSISAEEYLEFVYYHLTNQKPKRKSRKK